MQPNIKRHKLGARSCSHRLTKSRLRIPTEGSLRLIRWMDFLQWLLCEPDNLNFKIAAVSNANQSQRRTHSSAKLV